MSEWVERVARAMCLHDHGYDIWDDQSDKVRQQYLARTRATIAAMREPPKGYEKIVYHGDYGDDVWRDTIDKVLK